MLCRDTPTASARSCCVHPRSLRSSLTLFTVTGDMTSMLDTVSLPSGRLSSMLVIVSCGRARKSDWIPQLGDEPEDHGCFRLAIRDRPVLTQQIPDGVRGNQPEAMTLVEADGLDSRPNLGD